MLQQLNGGSTAQQEVEVGEVDFAREAQVLSLESGVAADCSSCCPWC